MFFLDAKNLANLAKLLDEMALESNYVSLIIYFYASICKILFYLLLVI